MRKTIFVPLMTLFIATLPTASDATPLAEAPAAWTLEVDTRGAGPGDAVPYRLAWTNHGAEAVRVPDDLFDRLSVVARYEPPAPRKPTVSLKPKVSPAASDGVRWRVLDPGESLQQIGTLGDFIADCVPGCGSGSYHLELRATEALLRTSSQVQRPPIAATEPVVLQWAGTIATSRPAPAIALPLGPHLVATLVRVGGLEKSTRATMRLKVRNDLTHAVYFPPKEVLAPHWSGRETRGDGGSGWGTSHCGSVDGNWGPKTGTLIQPGKTWQVDLLVEDLPADADRAWVTLILKAPKPFEPDPRGASAFYFAGEIQSLEARVY